MDVSVARRLASEVLEVGESRIWIDPTRLEEVAAAISRDDVRRLIKDGVIRVLPPSTPSRGRHRIKRAKRRGRGPGSRKGPRVDEKELWMARVRAQRRFLKALKNKGLIEKKEFWRVYKLIKGGMFRSIAHLRMYLHEHGLIKVSGSG